MSLTKLYILDSDAATLITPLDDFLELSWKRRMYEPSSAILVANRNQSQVSQLVNGRFIAVYDPYAEVERLFLIEQSSSEIDEKGKVTDNIRLVARGIDQMFEERIIIPAAATEYDAQLNVKAETAMRYYVDKHAGPGATAGRPIPGLVLAANGLRGSTIDFQGRFHTVQEALSQIGQNDSLGWEVLSDGGVHTFTIIAGTDRSASISLSVDLDTLLRMQWVSGSLDHKSYAVVAGQGEGAARTVVQTYVTGAAPTGFARREIFIDARDLDDSDSLTLRGKSKLRETESADTFKVSVNQFGSFVFGTDFELGDVINVHNAIWGVEIDARIVGVNYKVTRKDGLQPKVDVEIGRALPTQRSKIEARMQASSGSSRS